ncbi:hypothetical protein ACTXT7_010328 [Hymenolepis weldensis]
MSNACWYFLIGSAGRQIFISVIYLCSLQIEVFRQVSAAPISVLEYSREWLKSSSKPSYVAPKIRRRGIGGSQGVADGRLQVDDNILYINETPVMNRSFEEVLAVYHQASSEAESSQTQPPVSPLQPIRLIVSRLVSNKQNQNQSRTISARFLTVPQSSVLKEAAKLAAEIREECTSFTYASDSSPDMANFAEAPETAFFVHVNQHLAETDPSSFIFMSPDLDDSDGEREVSGNETTNELAEEVLFTKFNKKGTLIATQTTKGIERGVVIETTPIDKAFDAEVTTESAEEELEERDQQMDEIENDSPNSDIDEDDHPFKPSISKECYYAYPAQSASFESEENSANLILSDEKRRLLINHWTNTLDDGIEIINANFLSGDVIIIPRMDVGNASFQRVYDLRNTKALD